MKKIICKNAAEKYTPDSINLSLQAEAVKQLLYYCIEHPGASIEINISLDSGQKTTANLFDHAALVQGLIDALDYFQSEL